MLQTITVSGIVAGPDGPVASARVNINGSETTSNASGFYSISTAGGGRLNLSVRPPVSSRLSQVNLWLDNVTKDITQNFNVSKGYLLNTRFADREGAPIINDIWREIYPLVTDLQDNQWYSLDCDPATRQCQAVLPPDVYFVIVDHVPAGYYRTTHCFDLRTTDQTSDMRLNTVEEPPYPYDPPVAGRITISAPDDLGEAVITGGSGAVLHFAFVLLVNLNTGHQGNAISTADGSFTGRVFAPPGWNHAESRYLDIQPSLSSIQDQPRRCRVQSCFHPNRQYLFFNDRRPSLSCNFRPVWPLRRHDDGYSRRSLGQHLSLRGHVRCLDGTATGAKSGSIAGYTLPGR